MEIIYVDKFRKSFAMVFPIVTKPLQTDERLFYPPAAQAEKFRTRRCGYEEHPVADGQTNWWVGFSNPWICVPLAFLSATCIFHLQTDGWDLYVAIDVEAIVF